MIWERDKNAMTVVFIPGKGETGETAAALSKLAINGPFAFINTGWKPEHNVIAIQPPNQSVTYYFMEKTLNEIVRMGFKNIVLTGLSGGAEHIYTYLRTKGVHVDVKATIPMSFNITALTGDYYKKTDKLGENSRYTDMLMASIPSWGFCGNRADESHYPKMKRYYDLLIEANKDSRFTTYPTGHDSWNKYYDPKYKELGENIYEWAARMVKPTVVVPPPNQVPEIRLVESTDTVYFPNKVRLKAVATDDDTVTSFIWKEVNGEAIITGGENDFILADPLKLNGDLLFHLTVKDSRGGESTITHRVRVIYDPARIMKRISLGEIGELIILSNGDFAFTGPCK